MKPIHVIRDLFAFFAGRFVFGQLLMATVLMLGYMNSEYGFMEYLAIPIYIIVNFLVYVFMMISVAGIQYSKYPLMILNIFMFLHVSRLEVEIYQLSGFSWLVFIGYGVILLLSAIGFFIEKDKRGSTPELMASLDYSAEVGEITKFEALVKKDSLKKVDKIKTVIGVAFLVLLYLVAILLTNQFEPYYNI